MINKKEYKHLTPFKLHCLNNFPFIDADFDALTNWELLCKISEYLNDVIKNNNDIATDVTNLYNYVTNYFDNLDVQDEINTKLDEMAESGQLTEIIAQYLQLAGLLCYNTKNDLKNANNLSNGSFTKTFGTNSYNDGLGKFYKIRTLISSDIIDNNKLLALTNYPTLVAELITNIKDEKIGNKNSTLENFMIYDYASNQQLQGSCTDDEENIYSYIGGKLVKFVNGEVEDIKTVNLGHGNSLAYLNNYIYSAGYNDDRVLYRYNLISEVVEELRPFEDLELYDNLFGVEKYDDTHLICYLGYKDGTSSVCDVNKITACILDVDDLTYRQLYLTNTHNYLINLTAFQGTTYKNGKCLILASDPNCILEFIETANSANLETIYNIDYRDKLGLVIGEVEDISFTSQDGIYVLSSQSYESNIRSANYHLIGLQTEVTPTLIPDYQYTKNNGLLRYEITCDCNATSLYEDGTSEYPFHTFERAIQSALYSKIRQNSRITLKEGTYSVGNIYNVKGIQVLNSSGEVVTISNLSLNDSEINFSINGANESLIFDNLTIAKSKCTISSVGAELYCKITGKLDIKEGSVFMGSCTFTSPTEVNKVHNESFAIIRNYGIGVTGNWVNVENGGVLVTNNVNGTTTGGGTIIQQGLHSSD